MIMRLCLFILCLEFTYSFHRGSHRGSRLHQISDCFSNKSKFELNDAPFWQEPLGSLFANAIPFGAALYILQAQDKNQKESLANLEKTLATQDKNLKDTLATQDKNLKDTLATQDKNLKDTLATQDKNLKDTLATQDKNQQIQRAADREIWNINIVYLCTILSE